MVTMLTINVKCYPNLQLSLTQNN